MMSKKIRLTKKEIEFQDEKQVNQKEMEYATLRDLYDMKKEVISEILKVMESMGKS